MQFNTHANIIRFSKVEDSSGLGGWTEAETVLHENLPCRINWLRGSERVQFDRDTYYQDAKLYCRVVDVTTRDRVQYNGVTYEIVDVANVDSMNRYMVLALRRKL